MQQIEDEEKEMNLMMKNLQEEKEKRTSYYDLLEAHQDIQKDYLE